MWSRARRRALVRVALAVPLVLAGLLLALGDPLPWRLPLVLVALVYAGAVNNFLERHGPAPDALHVLRWHRCRVVRADGRHIHAWRCCACQRSTPEETTIHPLELDACPECGHERCPAELWRGAGGP